MFFRQWRAWPGLVLPLLLGFNSPARGADLIETIESPKERVLRFVFSLAADYSSTLSREQRFSLAANMPGLFGFRFACLFKPETGTARAVIPGDTVEAESKGKLTCPGGAEATLEEKARIVVKQIGHVPLFHVEAGTLKLKFGKSELILAVNDLTVRLSGLSFLQELQVRPEKEGYLVLCEKGNITAELEAGEVGQKHYLASTECRMELQNEDDGIVKQVLAGDAVQIANRGIPRGFRPDLMPLLGQGFAAQTTLWFEGDKVRWTTLKLQPNRKTTCSLFTQPAPEKPAIALKTFQADVHEGAIPLEGKPNAEQGFFMLCEDESGGWSSGVLQAGK